MEKTIFHYQNSKDDDKSSVITSKTSLIIHTKDPFFSKSIVNLKTLSTQFHEIKSFDNTKETIQVLREKKSVLLIIDLDAGFEDFDFLESIYRYQPYGQSVILATQREIAFQFLRIYGEDKYFRLIFKPASEGQLLITLKAAHTKLSRVLKSQSISRSMGVNQSTRLKRSELRSESIHQSQQVFNNVVQAANNFKTSHKHEKQHLKDTDTQDDKNIDTTIESSYMQYVLAIKDKLRTLTQTVLAQKPVTNAMIVALALLFIFGFSLLNKESSVQQSSTNIINNDSISNTPKTIDKLDSRRKQLNNAIPDSDLMLPNFVISIKESFNNKNLLPPKEDNVLQLLIKHQRNLSSEDFQKYKSDFFISISQRIDHMLLKNDFSKIKTTLQQIRPLKPSKETLSVFNSTINEKKHLLLSQITQHITAGNIQEAINRIEQWGFEQDPLFKSHYQNLNKQLKLDRLFVGFDLDMETQQLFATGSSQGAIRALLKIRAIDPNHSGFLSRKELVEKAILEQFQMLTSSPSDNEKKKNLLNAATELDMKEPLISKKKEETHNKAEKKTSSSLKKKPALTPKKEVKAPDLHLSESRNETKKHNIFDQSPNISSEKLVAIKLPKKINPLPESSQLNKKSEKKLIQADNLKLDYFELPRYPARARRAGIEGWVDVQFFVDNNGKPNNIEIIASKPSQVFDRAALNALVKWRYKPLDYRSDPQEERFSLRLRFEIE